MGFFAPVGPSGGRIEADPARWFSYAMRAAHGAHTPLDTVMRWPWPKTLRVWLEAQEIHDETWGLLLNVWYRRRDDD